MERWVNRAEEYCQYVMVDWNRKTFSVLDGLPPKTASVMIRLAEEIASIV